ncbi:MAG: HAMP domain-containing histidine kinase, partial [Bacteroidaceae bacterium]|nr:HAMP domain-containing histidine kinase [Bacteroidaceae bacterium]
MASIKRHYTLRLVAALVCVLLAYTLVLHLIYTDNHRLAISAALLMIVAVAWLWRTLRYPLRLVSHFLRALRGRDLMMRFPTSKDPLLGQACNDMNEILQLYWSEVHELEWRKKYYDRMLRVMTHELRNTVAPIVSLTDDVLKHPDVYDKERTHECLTIINEQAEGINTFLASYHQLTNVPEPVRSDIPIKELFAKLGRLLRNETGSCVLELNAPTEMRLYADPNLLMLTLINLVRNAAQSLEGCDNARIEVRATWANGTPYIT